MMTILNKFPQNKEYFLKTILILIIGLFAFSLFKNISYPLLWNDESYGAMNATRILKYGYPKIHDEKNVVFEPPLGYSWQAFYDAKLDVQKYIPWGNEYLSVPGVFIAQQTKDLYLKTALVRLPFACIGLLGLLVFLAAFHRVFPTRKLFVIFSILFFLIELCSVSLLLHMREARYYSAALFLTACFSLIFIRYFILRVMSNRNYWVFMTILFFFTYHVYYVLDVVFYCTLLVWVLGHFIAGLSRTRTTPLNTRLFLSFLIPVAASIALIFPFECFFNTLKTTRMLSTPVQSLWENQFKNLLNLYAYFMRYEFFIAGVVIKILAFVVWFKIRTSLPNKENPLASLNILGMADIFVNLFFVLFVLIISRSPLLLYTRAFVPILPVWVISMSLECIFLLYSASALKLSSESTKKFYAFIVLLVLAGNCTAQIPDIRGHVYELFHQYRGPLDFLIPAIRSMVAHPEELVIATNYESTSFMYYLGSKVIVGYIPFNLEADRKMKPDIVIFRRPFFPHQMILRDYVQNGNFVCCYFPVVNFPVNNIPELFEGSKSCTHLFRTWYTQDKEIQANMFVSRTLFNDKNQETGF